MNISIVDGYRADGKRFVVRADKELTALRNLQFNGEKGRGYESY